MSASEALQERDRVLDEVIAKLQARGTFSPAMQVFERYARTGREFSLNELREELTMLGVDVSKGMGGITIAAIKVGLIRKVDRRTSTSPTTNGKDINVYVGAGTRGGLSTLIPTGEQITVPVQRTRRGTFTSAEAVAQDALFDVEAC